MKFKKYMKESVDTTKKSLNEADFYNPDSEFSIAEQEMDRVYGPIRKLIADGKFEEARAELDALDREVDELEAENAKKKIFRYPRFIINGQRKNIAALRAKLPTNESIDDMDKRCENCNTLLNDMGTCPKCDEGEEDYEDHDDIDESLCHDNVVKYGAHWFATKDANGELIKNEQGKVKIFDSCEEARASVEAPLNEVACTNEDLSVREKLKKAYPELNFDNQPAVIDEAVEEELSVRERLKRAYPELNFDEPSELTEGTGADTAHAASEIAEIWSKQDGQEWAKTAKQIIDAIPDDLLDNAFNAIKNGVKDIKLNAEAKQKLKATAKNEVVSDEAIDEADTLDKILDAVDIFYVAKNNPSFLKEFLVSVLMLINMFEPTPFIDIAMIIIRLVPAKIVAYILAGLSMLTPVGGASVAVGAAKLAKKGVDNIKAKRAAAELDNTSEEDIEEGLSYEDEDEEDLDDSYSSSLWTEQEEHEYDYDDDYEFDDVEQDRIHTALYGGDATYCRKCGAFLRKNEWGSYCPECDDQ